MLGNKKGTTEKVGLRVLDTGILDNFYLETVKFDELVDEDSGISTASLLFVFVRKVKKEGQIVKEEFAYREYDLNAGKKPPKDWQINQLVSRVSHIFDAYAGFGANEEAIGTAEDFEEYFQKVEEAFKKETIVQGKEGVSFKEAEVYLLLTLDRDSKKTKSKAKVSFPNAPNFIELVKFNKENKKLKPVTLKVSPKNILDRDQLADDKPTMAAGIANAGMAAMDDYDELGYEESDEDVGF